MDGLAAAALSDQRLSRSRSRSREEKRCMMEPVSPACGDVSTASSAQVMGCGGSPGKAQQDNHDVKGLVTASKDVGPDLPYEHRRTAKEVRRCKRGKKSDVGASAGSAGGYHLNDEVLKRPITYNKQVLPLRRYKREDITADWFSANHLKPMEPCIIEDGCSMWPAMDRWALEALEERFRHVSFKVAKDGRGRKMRMKYKYFLDYIRRNQDDSPLYLFETNMAESGYIRPLLSDYSVPDLFPSDYGSLINSDSRPPWRWFCIGPVRSGTGVHQDPLGTDAWNALTHGTKRWVLFKPEENGKVVKGKMAKFKGEADEAIHYFDFLLPRTLEQNPDLVCWVGDQHAGDVIYVPGDWWHGVLNLEDTVAVTHNFTSEFNFDLVWRHTRRSREKVAYLWLRNMKKFAPILHDRAVELNRLDNFSMRHERPAGVRLPKTDSESSSSGSSSDSSSDEAADLAHKGLEELLPDFRCGPVAFERQGRFPFA